MCSLVWRNFRENQSSADGKRRLGKSRKLSLPFASPAIHSVGTSTIHFQAPLKSLSYVCCPESLFAFAQRIVTINDEDNVYSRNFFLHYSNTMIRADFAPKIFTKGAYSEVTLMSTPGGARMLKYVMLIWCMYVQLCKYRSHNTAFR